MSIAIGVSPCVRTVGCAQYVLRGFAARAYRRRAAGETRTIANSRTRGEGKGGELESSIAFKRTPRGDGLDVDVDAEPDVGCMRDHWVVAIRDT